MVLWFLLCVRAMELCVCKLQWNKNSHNATVCVIASYTLMHICCWTWLYQHKSRLQLTEIKVAAPQLGARSAFMAHPKWHDLAYWYG